MTRDQIIAMARAVAAARDSCMDMEEAVEGLFYASEKGLTRFAALVAASERERCAQICDAEASIEGIAQRCAANIRGMM